MDPVTRVGLGWLLFLLTHVGMATAPVRGPLVRRLGEVGFMAVYGLIADAVFIVLVQQYAAHGGDGPRGAALAEVAWLRWPLIGLIAASFALMTGAFAPRGYWESPMMVVVGKPRQPYGLERITRHPFFAGLVLFAGVHALLATRLAGTVFFAGFAVVSILGSAHQAGKLRARHGPGYQQFLEATSAVPFAAIAAGRQRLAAAEQPWLFLLLGIAIAAGLRRLHPHLLDHGGIYFSGAVVLGSTIIGVRAALRSRR